MKKNVCVQCGREFSGRKKKFCSANCRVAFHGVTQDLQEKICPVCGKKFMQKVTWQEYCSANCREEKEKMK